MTVNMPITDFLTKHKDKSSISFHMPGHKGGRAFEDLNEAFYKIGSYDITEIDGADNLHHSQGIIEQSQRLAAKLYNADHSFFLVNGTTSGIYAMILACTAQGEKIIIPRNCHKAILNAIIIGGLQPIYVNPKIDDNLSIATTVTAEDIEKAIIDNPDAKAVLITYPNYYGMACDIEKIVKIVHSHGMALLVDSAHGAHFAFNDKLPVCAIKAGADAVAHSIHKTLPSLTQSSILHINEGRIDISKVKFFLQLTQSTSPSYILMASLEQSMAVMDQRGRELIDNVLALSKSFKDKIKGLNNVFCLDYDNIKGGEVFDLDQTRIVINIEKTGLSTSEAEDILREKFNINIEFSDLYNLVCIASMFNNEEDFEGLYKGIEYISKKSCGNEIKKPVTLQWINSTIVYHPREAVYKSVARVKLQDAIGRVSGEYIIPYPPGIPLVVPGELITKECIDIIREYNDSGISITGLSDKTLNFINIIT